MPVAADLRWQIGRARETERFRQFLLEPKATPALQIDLARDFGPQYGQHQKYGNVIVDSIENIGANKLTAILGRTEPKDFVDLYFLLHSGQDFDVLTLQVDPARRGHIKQALVNIGYPAEDLIGYVDGEALEIHLRQITTQDKPFTLRDYQRENDGRHGSDGREEGP